MSLNFKVDLLNAVIDDGTIAPIIGVKCFASRANQGTEAPYIVFHVISASDDLCHGGADGTPTLRVQFDIYTKTADQAETLRDRLKTIFHGKRGALHATNSTDVLIARFLDEQDMNDYPTEYYRKTMDFSFKFQE